MYVCFSLRSPKPEFTGFLHQCISLESKSYGDYVILVALSFCIAILTAFTLCQLTSGRFHHKLT